MKALAKKILNDLGYSPDSIAANLAKWQMKGKIKSEDDCPVANHIKTQFAMNELAANVIIYNGSAIFYDKDAFLFSVFLPACVARFVQKFDRGLYKELVNV